MPAFLFLLKNFHKTTRNARKSVARFFVSAGVDPVVDFGDARKASMRKTDIAKIHNRVEFMAQPA
jgi:hypothetical protein